MIPLTEKENKAWELAKEVHKDQKRYSGQPYVHHVEEVVEILRAMNVKDEDLTITAILHDVLEDCERDEMAKNVNKILTSFGVDVLSNVLMLTHTKQDGRTYQEYVDAVIHTKSDVILVKIADMLQNLTETPTVKQREKYRIAFPKLLIALGERNKWKK